MSYTAHRAFTRFIEENGKVERLGFLEHARPVATGINGLLGRDSKEKTQAVLESIHVVPSLIEGAYRKTPEVVVAVVSAPDEEEHRHRFVRASYREPGRANAARHLENFSAIREINDFLVEDATRHGLPIVDSGDPDAAASDLVDRLWRRVQDADH